MHVCCFLALLCISIYGLGRACTTISDCSLNGDCITGQCHCDQGWVGQNCGILNLQPADPKLSYFAPNHTSAWGMSVVRDNHSGLYHGFVSQFANQCKLSSWGSNSYVAHVVAQSPEGPWESRPPAVSVWAHNPKVVYSPQDRQWIMYHIGDGTKHRPIKNCTHHDKTENHISRKLPNSQGTSPFEIHHSASLDGPWIHAPLSYNSTFSNVHMTFNTGFSAVPEIQPPSGGLWLFEKKQYGTGKLMVNFSYFSPNPHRHGVLAWDPCAETESFDLKFIAYDNGHRVHCDKVDPTQQCFGSNIGSFRLEAKDTVAVRAGNPCARTYNYPDVTLSAPFSVKNGTVKLALEVDYFEIVINHNRDVRLAGITQDGAGCRGICEIQDDCTVFSWAPSGACYVRNDSKWMPQPSIGWVSGRQWTFDGDNPAPYINSSTGKVTVMYRTDIRSGNSGHNLASLIGQAQAPSWKDSYSISSNYGGPISNAQYPYEENEDPFIYRNRHGWHALFHSCTWGDSHSTIWPVKKWAGRHAFSLDGVDWIYSSVPAYNGTIHFLNGSTVEFERVERPFLLIEDGILKYLYNGVQEYPWDDYTFTLVHKIVG